MNRFSLFDTVKLTQDIKTNDGDTVTEHTVGTIVEVYNEGEAYEVELFGNWVEYNVHGTVIPSNAQRPHSFVETIAVETLYPEQIMLVKTASDTVGIRAQLLAILDELSEDKLNQVKDFAETLRSFSRWKDQIVHEERSPILIGLGLTPNHYDRSASWTDHLFTGSAIFNGK